MEREESGKRDLLNKKVGLGRGTAIFLRVNLQITSIKCVKNCLLEQ